MQDNGNQDSKNRSSKKHLRAMPMISIQNNNRIGCNIENKIIQGTGAAGNAKMSSRRASMTSFDTDRRAMERDSMLYQTAQERKTRQLQELKDLALLNGKIQHLQ